MDDDDSSEGSDIEGSLDELKSFITGKSSKISNHKKKVRASDGHSLSITTDKILDDALNQSNLPKLKSSLNAQHKPLEKPEAKRLKRAAGFEEVAVTVNRWDGVVTKRKKADQLVFPLKQVDVYEAKAKNDFKNHMKTDLEKNVYNLLHGAKLIEEEKKQTEEELAIKKAMSLSEIKEKSREIWRNRILRQRLERKAALLNKSKSRKYHKILRRERLQAKKKEFERLKSTDPEEALKILDEIEKSRIDERMSLRHKSSKWLHLQQKRAGRDEMAKDLLKQNQEIRAEILSKQTTDSDEQKETLLSDKTQENVEGDEPNEFITDLKEASKWHAEEIRNINAKEISEKENHESGETNEGKEKKSFKSLFSTKSRKLGYTVPDKSYLKQVVEKDDDDESDAFEDDDDINLFSDEDNVEKFESEKNENEKSRNQRKEIDLYLEGWGSWAGPGIVQSEKKRKRFKLKAPSAPPSKYASVGNVIYNEESDVHQNIRKKMVNELPYPFTTVKDFEASVRQPIGRKFVPETSHKKLIAPSVVTKMGKIIEPIGEESLLQVDRSRRKRSSKLEQKLEAKLSAVSSQKKPAEKKKGNKNKNKRVLVKPLVIHK